MTSARIPAAIAIAFVALVFGSLWWKSRHGDDAPAPLAGAVPAARAAAPAPQPTAALRDFMAFAAGDAPAELPLDHGYTSQGLRKLAAALAAEGGNSLWRDRAARLREIATAIEADHASLDHADRVREAFVSAAEWIDDLRKGRGDVIKPLAEGISADEPLRTQGAQVAGFFKSASRALGDPPAS